MEDGTTLFKQHYAEVLSLVEMIGPCKKEDIYERLEGSKKTKVNHVNELIDLGLLSETMTGQYNKKILGLYKLENDSTIYADLSGLGLPKIQLFGLDAIMGMLPALGAASDNAMSTAVFAAADTDAEVAFAELVLQDGLIGINMIRESFGKEEEGKDYSLKASVMFTLAVATSIDAFAVGITFALLENVNLPLALSLIFFITFLMSALGVKIGGVFGSKFKSKAEFLGGTVLVLLGLKILLEHLGVISF